MIFNSFIFGLFFFLFVAAYFITPRSKRYIIVVIASLIFYGWWDERFLGLLLLSTGLDFFVARKIERLQQQPIRRLWLLFSLALNLGVLGFFKYFNFFSQSFSTVMSSFGFVSDPITLGLILPVGVSFYTFQAMSYVIDVYRGHQKAENSLILYFAYISYFPQLVAGPIERCSDLLPQIRLPRNPTRMDWISGSLMISWGYFLKVVVADNLARTVDYAFKLPDPSALTGFNAMVAIIAFAFQIYADFCGYSEIARGISKILGIDLSRNFRNPYLASDPRDFWQRWHVSLSRWLRDYLFIPLGGSRAKTWITHRNLMVTMLLGGLWHGASVLFLIWGAYHGILLILHRVASQYLPRGFPRHWLRPIWLGLIIYGWLIFRSESVQQLFHFTNTIFRPWEIPDLTLSGEFPENLDGITLFWIFFFGAIVLTVDWIEERGQTLSNTYPFPNVIYTTAGLIVLWTLIVVLGAPSDSFIYFQF